MNPEWSLKTPANSIRSRDEPLSSFGMDEFSNTWAARLSVMLKMALASSNTKRSARISLASSKLAYPLVHAVDGRGGALR